MMNKLLSDTRFSAAKSSIGIDRSKFNLSHGHHMTMNAGFLYPYFQMEVLPGDTIDFRDAFVNRMSTPKYPVMDTAFMDQWLFYVPWRLVWEHTKEFFGENNESAWTPQKEYFIPRLTKSFKPDGVGDYMGLPTNVTISVNALRFRSLRLIWNEFFRDQNTQAPKLVNMGDVETDLTLDELLPVNKRKDYFTTALPSPAKGPDVFLPLSGFVPVVTRKEDAYGLAPFEDSFRMTLPSFSNETDGFYALGVTKGMGYTDGTVEVNHEITSGAGLEVNNDSVPLNLWANLDYGSALSTINQLRQAFAVQSLYEVDARSGSRYREFLAAHFHVNVPDLTIQVPEFLAGKSTPINVSQVVQTSAGSEASDLGFTGAFSKTVGNGSDFVKSFDEPGYIIGVCAIRTLHSYQQGIERSWSRFSRLDCYHPVLAHIGEQPILNKELYAYGVDGDEVFGYQEPWAEYRYMQSYVSGAFRSNYPGGSLDSWTYTDDFDSTPRLSDEWMRETDVNVGRTLLTDNLEGAPQFIVDFWFDVQAYRPLPLYGTPAILGGRQ